MRSRGASKGSPGMMYFPTKCGAKESQNPPNKKVAAGMNGDMIIFYKPFEGTLADDSAQLHIWIFCGPLPEKDYLSGN